MRFKKFKNFTPHIINIYSSTGIEVLLSIPVETNETGNKIQVRVSEKVQDAEPINGVPVVSKSYGEVVGLPEPKKNVVLIVSVVVLNALAGSRDDVVCPDTGKDSVVRDETGSVLGVRRFQK